MSNPSDTETTHFLLISSSGMGHIAPFCRLAAALSTRGCAITFLAAQPTVSNAESVHISNLITSYPSIHLLNLPLIHLPPSQFPPTSHDPFYLRVEAIRRSAHLLHPLLTSLPNPPISAAIIDIMLISSFVPVAKNLNLPSYVMFTSSLTMFSLFAHFPTYASSNREIGDVRIPGVITIKKSSLPPPLHDPTHLFRLQFIENAETIRSSDGVLVNTFQELEPIDLSALNLPPVYRIGPLGSPKQTPKSETMLRSTVFGWLEGQPRRSVVYVSFGSRTAMSREQIRELGRGLEMSGCRFLWMLKTKKVDKEEEGLVMDEVIGEEGYVERVKGRGMVVNGWVEQEEVLGNSAVGLFVSHCGWNSVTEAARMGVRVLGWPRMGDQRVNGEVVRRSGVGEWMEEWGWEVEKGVVEGEDIGRKVKEVMEDEKLGRKAEEVGSEAMKAVGVGGSSKLDLEAFIRSC